MKTLLQKLIGMMLAVVMVASMLPAAVIADDAVSVASFVIGGETYVLTDTSVMDNDGKKYYGMINASSLYSQEGNYGYMTWVPDEDLTTDTDKYYTGLTFHSMYGAVMRNGVSVQANPFDILAKKDMFFPAAYFDGHLKKHDYTLATNWA